MTRSKASRALLRLSFFIVLGAGSLWLLNRQAGGFRLWPDTAHSTGRVLIHKLTVASLPQGASLLVNGQIVGATPVTLENVPEGLYGLRFERDGFKPLNRQVKLGSGDLAIAEKLETLPTGLLTVEVEPAGAEVLLDGEFIGLTPFKDARVSAGGYELLIRKTNFEPHSAPATIKPGEPQIFAGFELKDRVLAMLEAQVKSEPQRLAHYLDLAHYLFINDKMDDAVDVFARGLEILQTPLDFDEQGYNGKENMTQAEIALELRLRKEDEQRYPKEIEKHQNWPHKDVYAFRKKMDQMQALFTQRNIGSWTWVEQAARLHLNGGNYEHAAKIYRDYIAAAPTSPNAPKAYAVLIELYLLQSDLDSAAQVFGKFYELYQNDASPLQYCGQIIAQRRDRMTANKDRLQLLGMAEKALRKAAALPGDNADKTQCLCDLAAVLVYAERAQEAAPLYEQVLRDTADEALHEQRSLQFGEALRQAGALSQARALYEKLEKSENSEVRARAKTGLSRVSADEMKKKVEGGP